MSFAPISRADLQITRHPMLHSAYCINKKQRLSPCSVCRNVCPKGVYTVPSGSKPRWNECINCGLCSAQCPARCITPSRADIDNYLFAMMDTDLPIISCERSPIHATLQVDCLGTIPWEYLAYLSLTHHVVLYRGACGSCSMENGEQCFQASIEKLSKFHEGELEEYVLIGDTAYENLDFLRNERPVFVGAAKRGQNVVAHATSGLQTRDFGGLLFRNMLADLVDYANEHAPEVDFTCRIDLPQPNDRCYGCGICADLCPHGALIIETDKNDVVTVSLNVWKCVGCGTCSIVCRRGAMEKPRPTKVATLRKIDLARFQATRCTHCGRLTAPEEGAMCTLCIRKRNSI